MRHDVSVCAVGNASSQGSRAVNQTGTVLQDAYPSVRGAVLKCVTSSRSARPQGGSVLPADGEPRLPRGRCQPLQRRGLPDGLKPDPEWL